MIAYTILRWHIVIGNAFFRQNRANSYIFAILIRRASLFDDIRTEARTLVDAEDGLWAVAIATSLLTAAATGQAVDLSALSQRFAPA